jgi:hypothetical protein
MQTRSKKSSSSSSSNQNNNIARTTGGFTTPPPSHRRNNQQPPRSTSSVASVAFDSSRSTTASARSQNPLPNHLVSQLCEDIKALGGIETHICSSKVLYHLLNHLVKIDPVALSLYKEPNHPVRRKIQQKVYHLQGYDKAGT